jgi:hypothetical protein
VRGAEREAEAIGDDRESQAGRIGEAPLGRS